MKLYFLRHADAVEGGDDAARPLSRRGQEEARAIGAILRRVGVEFEAVFSSPLVRARETAEVTLEICQPDHDLRIEFTERLLNSASAEAFAAWLKQIPEKPNVLLVGHAPSIEDRVRNLLSITRPEALPLPKGSLACVETADRRTGSLRFFITPQMLGI